jgi:hypothetical protein
VREAVKPLSRDTPLDIEEVWLEALRRRGGLFQLRRLAELVQLGRQAARVAMRRAHPEASPVELDELLLRELYGEEAARDVVALRVELGCYEQ